MITGRVTVRDGRFALAANDGTRVFDSPVGERDRTTAAADAMMVHTDTNVGEVEVTAGLAMYPEYSRRWEGWELVNTVRFLALSPVRLITPDGVVWDEFNSDLEMMLPSDVEFRAFVRTDRDEQQMERWLFELRPFLRQDLEVASGPVSGGGTSGGVNQTPVVRSGTVDVSYHSFLISGTDIDPTATYTSGTVFDAGNELISVHTGIAAGPATVVVEQYDGDPLLDSGTPPIDLDQWDNVDEVIVVCRRSLHVITLDGELVDELGSLPPSPTGARAVRIATRGRAAHWDSIVDQPTEEYLVQTWPSGGPSMIASVKRNDGIWESDTSK